MIKYLAEACHVLPGTAFFSSALETIKMLSLQANLKELAGKERMLKSNIMVMGGEVSSLGNELRYGYR